MPGDLALSIAFFLSGAASLIFEVVWFYRAGLVFGNSVWAASIVLSSFMAGLAIGTALAGRYGPRLPRPVRAYARLEAIVATSGMLLTYLLPIVPPLVGGGDLGRLVSAFALLVVPATAMGATLPLLVGALTRTDRLFARVLGRMYAWNTFGAVAGAIAAEVLLIDRLGVAGAAWMAAALDALAALIALAFSERVNRRAVRESPLPAPPRPPTLAGRALRGASATLLLVCAAAAGVALLSLEVIWFRFISMYVLTTTLAMTLMLAVVLASIAAGGLAGALWARRDPGAPRAAPIVALLMAAAVGISYWLFGALTSGNQVGDWRRVLWFTIVEAAPVSVLSGLLFTLLGGALERRVQEPTRAAAALTFANTIGAMAGAPLAAFVLLPRFGMEQSFFLAVILYAAVALAAWFALGGEAIAARSRGFITAAALAVAVALLFPFGRMSASYFPRAAAAYASDESRIVATREGPSETIFVMAQQWLGAPVYHRLVTNGFSMSGTSVAAMRYMRYFAYLPMFLHRPPLQRALVVCYGVGVTARAVADIPSLTSIDVVEISKDVVAASADIYPPDRLPLADPRVRLHLEDGRYFLQTTGERYDLITGEPPPPRNPGAVNIYTREYFQLIRDRLADGGLASYWVPIGRPDPGTDVDTIIRAFCDVFDDCTAWTGTPFDLILVGSRGATGALDETVFAQAWQTAGLQAKLREVGFEEPEQIGATFIGDAAYLRTLTAATPPLTDNFPQRLRPVAGRPSLSDPRYNSDPAIARRFVSLLDTRRTREHFQTSPYIRERWPGALALRTLPDFELQAIINRVMWEGGHPLAQIEELHKVLTETRLRTLPLWILGSDEVKQRIAESAAERTGPVEYARALRAISGRDFNAAVLLLAHAEQLGLEAPAVRPLLVYALIMSDRVEEARQLARASRPRTDEERHFWGWLGKTFGVKP
jgi:spermidine synthase